MDQYEQLDLFCFQYDENGNPIDFIKEHTPYPLEDIIKGYEDNDRFKVIATFYTGFMTCYTMTMEEVRQEIKQVIDTKCYHFGNLSKNIYAYTYRFGKEDYLFCIENDNHIVAVWHRKPLDDLLFGKELILYPACALYMFDKQNNYEKILSGYGNYKADIRWKILCGEFEILKFSTNRINENKPVKEFYECEFPLSAFIEHWKED